MLKVWVPRNSWEMIEGGTALDRHALLLLVQSCSDPKIGISSRTYPHKGADWEDLQLYRATLSGQIYQG